jgi:hypothetical protein
MMTKKQTEQKHSAVVIEKCLDASAPLEHVTFKQLNRAVEDFKAKEYRRAALPRHIQVIQRLGVIDARRGYTDQDIARYAEARELAERELKAPGDFVSKGSTSVGCSIIATGERKRKNPDYLEIWEYVEPKLRRGEMMKAIVADAEMYFEQRGFKERKIERAIAWVRANPDKVSGDS